MGDNANQDFVADNVSDVSSFSDSSDEGKKVVEVVEEAIDDTDKPIYSEEDLETLVGFIRSMIFLFDYDEGDSNDEVAEIIKLWLTDTNNPLLFIFYDGDILSATLAFPLCPFNDLMYFMREPEQLFNVIERFHDDIMFGTLHSDIEGSLLVLLEHVYGPLIVSNSEWSENVKGNILTGYNSFMTYLNELHYKLSGFTLLYVPREGNDMDVQEAVLNRSMIKRLEAVVIDWTSQIRSTLSDTQHFVPDDLICPSDEYNFWIYRHEILSAIVTQFESPNIQHILKILDLAQSLYIKPLREVLADLRQEIEIAESNIPFLKLLVNPCFAIRTLDNEDDLCSQLIYVMHIIRFIGTDSSHLRKDECITKLFLYLSNEIVSCCMQSIDIDKILAGEPDYGIQICNLKINGCESYKIIYEEMLDYFKQEFVWDQDNAAIFNRINAFMQRLYDVLEICEAMLIFGKYGGSGSYKYYNFSCNNAKEYEEKCDQVEKTFIAGIETIKSVSGSILDINNKEWYNYIADFREMLKNLDDVIENLLSNVFLVAENLEEKIEVLVTLLNFYERDNIKKSFMKRITDIWNIFNEELTALSKEISCGINTYPSILPRNSGQYTMLKIKFDRICRLKHLLERCRFFPQYADSEEILLLSESCDKQVKIALRTFNDVWIKTINVGYGGWFHRNLICRSQIRPGLLECHIERRMLLIFNEAHFFKVLGATIPVVIDLDKNESTKQTFDAVIRIALYFNNVVSSISEKERLFFKPMIQNTERKLEPLRSKFTWDEDLSEYIDTFVVNVKELLDVIQIYKRENILISKCVENIFNLSIFNVGTLQTQHLADLVKSIEEEKRQSLSKLLHVYTKTSKFIFTIFEQLGANIRKMGESWAQYIQKIDQLLKAALFNSSFRTLESIRMTLAESSSPILSIEIILDKRGIEYQPAPEMIAAVLKRFLTEVTSVIKLIPSMCQRYQIDSDNNFYEEFLENERYLQLKNDIDIAITSIVEKLASFKDKWNIFRPFWSVNRTTFIEKFRLTSMTSEAFKINIEKFDELLNQLSTQSDFTVCKCVEVDALKLKYAITSHIHDWQIKYIEYLKCVSYGRIIEFNNKLNKNMEILSVKPVEVEDLKLLETNLNNCFNDIQQMENEIRVIGKYFDVLEKYVSDLLPEASNLRQNINCIWQRYVDYLNQIKEDIENYQNQFKLSIGKDLAHLKVNALEMLKMLDEDMPTSDDLCFVDAFLAIDKLMDQLERLEAQEKILKEKMALLGVEYHPLDALIEIRRKLEGMKSIWLLVEEWMNTQKETYVMEYAEISVTDIKWYAKNILCRLQELDSTLSKDMEYPIYLKTKTEILDYNITVSILAEMKASNLRDRHWQTITQLTALELHQNDILRLKDFVDHKFHNYEDDFKKLCFAARKEYEIEIELANVQREVGSIRYKTKRSIAGTYCIQNADECFRVLKSNSTTISVLLVSVYRHPFQQELYSWEVVLTFIIDLLEAVLLIESRSNMLLEIFRTTESADTFEVFNQAFRLYNTEWTTLVEIMNEADLLNAICPRGQDFLKEVEMLRKHFEDLYQNLNVLLDDKRNACSRLYLVPDKLLIETMAHPTNDRLLQHCMDYCFENIKQVSLRRLGLPQKYNRWEISELITKDNEKFLLCKPISFDALMNVDYIIAELDQSMQDTFKRQLRKCLYSLKQNYFRRVECGWFKNNIYQACMKSVHIENTLLIRNALVQSDLLGKAKPLRMLRTMHNKQINDLFNSMKTNYGTQSERLLERKLSDTMILEINTRDIIDDLVKSKVTGLKNFEWLSQLRSYWNDETNSCSVAHMDSNFHYGFECKQSVEPMFMTPHTNRLIMTVTKAMKHRLVPYLIDGEGYSGGCIFNQLSMELGVFFVTLHCELNWKMENVIKYINGLIKLQAWLCFSGIENLSSGIFALTNEFIRTSLTARVKHKVLDLKQTKIVTRFQFFAITRKQSIEVTNLERSLIRPMYAIFPDQEIAVQNLLCSCGFQQYRHLAYLVKLFLKHIKEYLPDQHQIWTLARLQEAILRSRCLLFTTSYSEDRVLASALQEEFSLSMPEKDKQIFENCVNSIFSVKLEDVKSSIDEDVESTMYSLGMKPSQYQERKVKETLSCLALNRPLIVIGGAGCGKTAILQTAISIISAKETNFKQYYVNPEALKLSDNGIFDSEKFEEILTSILESTDHSKKCLIFDTIVKDNWLKCVTSIESYKKTNLSKIDLKHVYLKVIVETSDMSCATPTTVANFAIVHVDDSYMKWDQPFYSWLSRTAFLEIDTRNQLEELAQKYLDLFFDFEKTASRINRINAIHTFCNIYEYIINDWIENKTLPSEAKSDAFTKLFFFCCVWSIGSTFNENERRKFDIFIREQIADTVSIYPLKGNVFQYFIEIVENNSRWTIWNLHHLDINQNNNGNYIYTVDNIPYHYLIVMHLRKQRPVIITSDTTVGKSALIKNILNTLENEGSPYCVNNLSGNCSPSGLEQHLRHFTMKIAKKIVYPKDRKHMIVFLDDFHTVLEQNTNTVEFLRQLIEYKVWYDNGYPQRLMQTRFISAMRNVVSLRSRTSSTTRLLNKFYRINHNVCDEETTAFIFSKKIEYLQHFEVSKTLLDLLAPATIDLIRRLGASFPATPNKPRYQFSSKTIYRILHAFCIFSTRENIAEKTSLLRLWIHECYRETWDLLEKVDYRKFYEIFNDVISKFYEATLHGLCQANRSPLFCDLLSEDTVYEDVKEIDNLIQYMEMAIDPSSQPSSLIAYHEAIEYCAKLLRMLRIGSCHTILVGAIGSGREIMCQLTKLLINHKISINESYHGRQSITLKLLEIHSKDSAKIVAEKFQDLFSYCIHQHTICVLRVDENDEVNVFMLEILNSFITNGIVADIYPCSEERTENTETALWENIKRNLHFVICAPVISKRYRKLLNSYPTLWTSSTIICMHSLMANSLTEISRKFLRKYITFDIPIAFLYDGKTAVESVHRKRESLVQSTEDRLQNAAADAISRIHFATKYEIVTDCDVLCSWFYELLSTFERLLNFGRKKLCLLYKKFYGGIHHIVEATNNVKTLQEQFEKQQDQIAEYQQELEEFITNIEIQTAEADMQSQEVEIRRGKIGAEEVICKQLAAVAEADLEKAMPALNAAIAALDSLNKKDMNEIKSYSRPPIKVELVLNAVMILLGKEPTWAEAKRQLGEQKFLDTLRNFDKNHIGDKTLKIIGGYVRNPELEPNKVGTVSKAAKSLILWVRAIENYGKVYRFVGPKIKKMEDARASLLEKQLSLQEAERKMIELAEKLSILRKEYEIKMKCKEELEEAARQMALKLERSRALVNSLSSEKERWMKTVEGLQHEYSHIIGDALLAAGSVVYFGSLSFNSRNDLKTQWKVDLEALEISFTESFSLFEFFYQPDDSQNWQDCGLPVDDFCVENATIVLNSVSRIPLAIDLQGEIQHWMLKLHSISQIPILRCDFNENISEGLIATAVQEQKPILIWNMLEQNLHNFHDLKIAYKKAVDLHCEQNAHQHSTTEIQCIRSFPIYEKNLLFLISSEEIHFTSALKKSVNMVNFILGLSGLEIKLLAIVVEHENPSLEERKEILMRSIISNKSTLNSLEENILRILNESEVPLIENEDLYETLQVSKDTAENITNGLVHAQQARQDIESSREIYKPCAIRAALLFLVLEDLKQFSRFYRFSLDWYLGLFQKSLEKSSKSQIIGERRARIIDFHTFNVFRNVGFALNITDQKLFAFCLCVHLMFMEEKISAKELAFLLNGAEKVERSEQVENPGSDWIIVEHWDNITELDKLPGFRGLVQSFEEAIDDWRMWYLSSIPELEKLPESWERNLTKFQKYLVVRSLRLDRFEPCVIDFLQCNLGDKYVNFKRASLHEVFLESSTQTPILLICRPNCNPWSEVKMLAKSLAGKAETKLQYLDMKTESMESFVYHLKDGVKKEIWLYTHDCHKSDWLSSSFETILAYLKTVNVNSNFRWWLTTDENLEHFPLNILQASIKFMYTEPVGIKQTMKLLYEEIGEEKFKKIAKSKYYMQHKKLLFSLAFFHSLLVERNKFQTLGWVNRYFFSVLDFQLSEKLLKFGLEELMLPDVGTKTNVDLKDIDIFELEEAPDDHSEAIPWQFINTILLEFGYGTQITNKWDRRIFKTHCREVFRQQLITVPECPLVPYDTAYLLPRDGNYQSYINYIRKSLPYVDGINVFGQNENANIKYLESQSSYMLQMLRKAHLCPSKAVNLKNEEEASENYENIKQTILELLATLPVYLDYGNATKIVGANKTSVDDCLLYEISAYNEILERVKRNLEQIARVLSGEHDMYDLHQEFIIHIRHNRIPQAWIRYPTNKFLSDWIIDLRYRTEYFRRWTETGQLPTDIVLGLFTKPRLFMHGVLKFFAKVNNVPVAELSWAASVFPTMKPMVRFPISEGFIGRGFYLENAGWDLEKQCLRHPKILELHCPMPPIAFKPIKRDEAENSGNSYFCPCYYSICRSEETFIFGVSLNAGDDDKETWIKFGTAMLLTT